MLISTKFPTAICFGAIVAEKDRDSEYKRAVVLIESLARAVAEIHLRNQPSIIGSNAVQVFTLHVGDCLKPAPLFLVISTLALESFSVYLKLYFYHQRKFSVSGLTLSSISSQSSQTKQTSSCSIRLFPD